LPLFLLFLAPLVPAVEARAAEGFVALPLSPGETSFSLTQGTVLNDLSGDVLYHSWQDGEGKRWYAICGTGGSGITTPTSSRNDLVYSGDRKPLDRYPKAPRFGYLFGPQEGTYAACEPAENPEDLVGLVLFVRTHGDVSYGKLKVMDATPDAIFLGWTYQEDGSHRFTPPGRDAPPSVSTVSAGRFATHLSLTPDESEVWVNDKDNGVIHMVCLQTGLVTHTIDAGEPVFGIEFNPFSGEAFIAASGRVLILDRKARSVTSSVELEGEGLYHNLRVHPDGSRLYATERDSVAVIDLSSGSVSSRIPLKGPAALATTPDGKKLLVTSYSEHRLWVIDTRTHAVVATIPVGCWPHYVAVTPDGTRAYVSNMLGKDDVTVVDLVAEQRTASLSVAWTESSGFPLAARGIAVSPDGLWGYLGEKKSLYRFSTITNEFLECLPTSGDLLAEVTQQVVIDSGGRIYAANSNGTVSVVQPRTGQGGPEVSRFSVTPRRVQLGKSARVSWRVRGHGNTRLWCQLDLDGDGLFEMVQECRNGALRHRFTREGTHRVQLVAADERGAVTTLATEVTVASPDLTLSWESMERVTDAQAGSRVRGILRVENLGDPPVRTLKPAVTVHWPDGRVSTRRSRLTAGGPHFKKIIFHRKMKSFFSGEPVRAFVDPIDEIQETDESNNMDAVSLP
jgi:YVTN family beta-propeller protein